MGGFDRESMKAWYELLPDDVASSMEPPEDDSPATAEITAAVAGITSGKAAVELVASRPDDFIGFGRARRVRFLAWLANRNYPDTMAAIIRLTDVDSSSEESGASGGNGGAEKVAPYFKEDVRALVESLGPRAARGIVDGATLAAVMGAAYQAASELEMRSGGAR